VRATSDETTPAPAGDAPAPAAAPAAASPAEGEGASKSLRRALRLLRIVAEQDAAGVRLRDLAQASGLHQATAHRLLTALVDEGMVWMDPDTKRYNLGVQTLLMADMARWAALRSHFRAALETLAHKLMDDVHLAVVSGYDAVLVDSVTGSFPGRIVSPGAGTRQPLGAGAAAIALLAAYRRERARQIWEHNLPRYKAISWITAEAIWEEVLATSNRGYTVVKGQLVEEATAVAVAFTTAAAQPLAAIGVSANNSRMLPERRTEIAALIRAEVEALGPMPGA
jgi:DNA-binding IclR family transcriptional regulator